MTIAINEFEQVLDLTAQLSAVDQLCLIERLVAQVRAQQVIAQQVGAQQERESAPVDMLSLVGVGAELWQQIDVDAYLERERTNWER